MAKLENEVYHCVMVRYMVEVQWVLSWRGKTWQMPIICPLLPASYLGPPHSHFHFATRFALDFSPLCLTFLHCVFSNERCRSVHLLRTAAHYTHCTIHIAHCQLPRATAPLSFSLAGSSRCNSCTFSPQMPILGVKVFH